jgi:hypothetical protein
MGFQVGGHSGLLHVNQPSSQVEMNNKAKPTVILPGTWYTFRMVFSGGTCSLYKKTDTSLWELAAYWSSLMVSSENMISAFQISLGFAAEVKLEYLKIASGVHAPSNEPEMEEDSIDLFAELEARRSGILALAGEFVVRHPGSGDLKAGLELRTVCISQGISIEAYIRSEAIKNCNGI